MSRRSQIQQGKKIIRQAEDIQGSFYSVLRWGLFRLMKRLSPQSIGCSVLLGLLLIVLVWFFRPLPIFHGIAMFAVSNPIAFFIDILSITLIGYRLLTSNRVPYVLILTIFLVDIFLLPRFSAAFNQQFFVNDLQITHVDELPLTTKVRWLPYDVAKRFGDASMQEPTLELGEFHSFDYQLNEISWVAPQEPRGFMNTFRANADGFKFVRPDGTVKTFHGKMKYGEGMCCFDNIRWQLYLRHYFMELGEIYYIEYQGEVLALAPYITYYFHFPLSIPQWGGVFVVHNDGTIEDLTPQEAQQDQRFVGQRLYPRSLALKIGEAYAWRLGIYNYYVDHIDQTEIPHLEHGQHQFPFLIPTSEGPTWFIPLDPAGNGQGIYKILYIDAHTGEVHLREYDVDSNLLGPAVTKDYLRLALPNYNWILPGEDSQGNFYALEPRPVVTEEKETGEKILYWMFTVTTREFSGVNVTGLVSSNPSDPHVLLFNTPEELELFLTQGVLPDAQGDELNPAELTTNEIIQWIEDLTEELGERAE